MEARVSQRLDEGISGATYYTSTEVVDALNEAYRFFVFLTLGLETTAPFALSAGTVWYHMLSTFADWIVPLRILLPNGAEVREATLSELDSLDQNWLNTAGTPARHAHVGIDLLAVYPQPAAGNVSLQVTYAQAPATLALATDTPAIPQEFHAALVDYAVYALRRKEGAQELRKVVPLLQRFLEEAKKYGDYVRARSAARGYSRTPIELRLADISKLLAAGSEG
jgi:hypothetical protein